MGYVVEHRRRFEEGNVWFDLSDEVDAGEVEVGLLVIFKSGGVVDNGRSPWFIVVFIYLRFGRI